MNDGLKPLGRLLDQVTAAVLIAAVRAYQLGISPLLGLLSLKNCYYYNRVP